MAVGRLGAVLGWVLIVGAPGPAAAADMAGSAPLPTALVAPPRTLRDITAVLDEYKPPAEQTAGRIAAADQQPSPGMSDAALADFYLKRNRAARDLGRVAQRLADLQQARALAEKAGIDLSPILLELSNTEAQLGNHADAIRDAETRAQLDDRTPTHARLFSSYERLVSSNLALGHLTQAEHWLDSARTLYRAPYFARASEQARLGWQSDLAAMESEIQLAKGQYREAEASLRTGIALRQRYFLRRPTAPDADIPGGPETVNDLIARLADALRLQGRLIEAEVEARRALVGSLKNRGRYAVPTATRLESLSRIMLDQGRAVDAERLARAKIDILETIEASGSWALANARSALGSALLAQDRAREALASFDAMMAGLAAGDEAGRRHFGFGGLDWATVLIKTGELAPALAMTQRQLEVCQRIFGNRHYQTAEARAFFGMALAAQGQRDAALQAFRDALPILLEASPQSADDSRTAKARRLRLVLDAYIRLLAALRGTPLEAAARIDAATEAFQIADAARGQAVQQALVAASARVTLNDPALAALARREQDAGQTSSGLEATLVNALSAPADQQDPSAIDALRGQIQQLRDARAGMRREIAQRFPDYAALISPKPASLEAARRALRPGETLVATYVSDDVTLVWTVSAQGPVGFASAPIGRAALAASVKELRRALDPPNRGEVPRFDVVLAGKLYDTLLRPVEPGWRAASSLLVVPDQALGQLPLGVLVTAPTAPPAEPKGQPMFAGYKSVPFLARQVAITQLPSVAALTTLRALPPASSDRKPFIGFGDPAFSASPASVPPALTPATLTTRGVRLAMRGAPMTEQADSATLAMLPRLPDTADEVRAIARALRADPDKDVFVGAAANERTVESLNLTDRRVIAFATHGLVPGDLDGLTEPALALSAPQQSDGESDGLLTMGEVLGLKLNADWVVLSACNTAAGDGAGAEAVSGLGRAFFYAGARALLVSNWPVETTAARALTTDLFRRQAGDPQLGRAAALQQAEVALIDGEGARDPATGKVAFSYAHPIFWAPFSLIGDGGAP